jgi:glycosyltransferase involved in cell wall biosynthesis
MKIGFYLPHLDIQGTGVSCFDYAYYNEKILGNKSYFFCVKNHQGTHPLAEKKFKDNLDVIEIENESDMLSLDKHCKDLGLDALYIQKLGKKYEGGYVESTPMLIHCVGAYNEPHGKVYSYVSEWLSSHCSNNRIPFVPYMVHLPETDENLRKELGIPSDAIVFGRTGGPYSWNIPFVNDVIKKILDEKKNVYFLFANTNHFINHDRVIFHEPFADLIYKRKFINTCDAFLHARSEGESFGASVAEFSICNKPIITFSNSPERNHILTLKEKGIYYNDFISLYNILNEFTPQTDIEWNAYQAFTPEKVMEKFKNVFLS